jgi:uncharacterized membrane protein
MNDGESPERTAGFRTTRTEAFSDGVFAIAITLLVLEIGVPDGAGDDLLSALVDQWPSYLAYIVSFASIGAVWFAHTVITEGLHHTTKVFVRLNLLLLLVVSFLPFPTRLLAEYIGDPQPARVAATVYGINLLLTSLLVSALWRYAVHAGLVRRDLATEDVVALTRRLTPGLAGYIVMIVLGVFVPVIAVIGYFAIAVFILVPFHVLRRRSSPTPGP